MSHAHGTYLGGVWSVEDLRKRCRIDDETGCWHWSLRIADGAPMVKVCINGIRRPLRGRAAAIALSRGAYLPAGHLAWARAQCKSSDCVNPAHAKSGTKKQWGADLAASGCLKGLPQKVLAGRAAGRGRRALTPEQVALVKASDKTHVALAAELRVSKSLVADVRLGKRYVDDRPLPGASVFAWGQAA